MEIKFVSDFDKTEQTHNTSFIDENTQCTQIELTRILNEYDLDGRMFDAWIANGGTYETFIAEYAS